MSTTTAGDFIQGNIGEQYVRRHIQQLLSRGFISNQLDTAGDHVEGGDSRIVYNRFGEELDVNDLTLGGLENIAGTGYRISCRLIGGLEVKTVSNFIFRNNDNNEPSGTLPLELWSNKDREKLGWLLELLYPEIRLQPEDEQPIHAVQPVLFCFLLVSYLGPFACVMFEDFPALAQRLKELALTRGILLEPASIPTGEEAVNWRSDDPYIIDNMWHIPFKDLNDLATVTMIGEKPLFKQSIRLGHQNQAAYETLQQARYDFLHQCAENRSIPGEDAAAFYPADTTRIFADILNNMKIIEQLREEDYPYLFEALKSRNMRAHLNCILLNMYSHPMLTPTNIMHGFLQAKKYLDRWGHKRGIPGSTFSWQSHIIFLTDAGLIKKFVMENPSGRKTYRSVPRYTSHILKDAEEKAKAYIEAGINLNYFTKSEVIKVSGQERANILYYNDERIISGIEDTVTTEFIETAIKMLEEKGYAIPGGVQAVVSEKIHEEYWYDPLDPDPDPERESLYKKANNQVEGLQKKYKALAKEILERLEDRGFGLEYRELKRDEKQALNLPITFKKKVYVMPF